MGDNEITVTELLDLLETNKRLVAAGNRQKMLDFLLDETIRRSGAERGFVIFAGDDGFDVASARSFDREALKKAQEKFSKTVLTQVMETGRPLLAMDAEKDERLKTAQSIAEMQLRSILCLPIRAGERALGAIYLDNRFTEGAFQEGQVRILGLFADQAALALSSMNALEESERQSRELERLQKQLALLNEELEGRAAQAERERDDANALLGRSGSRKGFEGIVGTSKPLRKVLQTINRLKDSDVTVTIHGESGTGKELIARSLHRRSPRRERPFVAVNCAAMSETLLDSELFGHVRGAFTGADRERKGLFEEASGGTIFLDEIGETSPAMQAKLLRVLQEREIRPVGSNITRKVDVRVVCASNRDLKKMTAEGTFREDLYYRLNVVRIDLPPLRERREDIPDLVRCFMERNGLGIPKEFLSIDPEAMRLLMDYSWPGNIRELQNEMERCLALGRGGITVPLLSPAIQEEEGGGVPEESGVALDEMVKRLEKKVLAQTLERAGGNKAEVAARLGISRGKLYQKLRRHGLSPQEGRADASKIRSVLGEVRGNKSMAARRLGIGRRTLYDRLNKK